MRSNGRAFKPSTYRLFKIRILVRIRRRAAAEKAQRLCSRDRVPRARRDEDRVVRADHLKLIRCPRFDSCAPRPYRPLGLPIYVARVPAAPFSLLPWSLYLDHSHARCLRQLP